MLKGVQLGFQFQMWVMYVLSLFQRCFKGEVFLVVCCCMMVILATQAEGELFSTFSLIQVLINFLSEESYLQ